MGANQSGAGAKSNKSRNNQVGGLQKGSTKRRHTIVDILDQTSQQLGGNNLTLGTNEKARQKRSHSIPNGYIYEESNVVVTSKASLVTGTNIINTGSSNNIPPTMLSQNGDQYPQNKDLKGHGVNGQSGVGCRQQNQIRVKDRFVSLPKHPVDRQKAVNKTTSDRSDKSNSKTNSWKQKPRSLEKNKSASLLETDMGIGEEQTINLAIQSNIHSANGKSEVNFEIENWDEDDFMENKPRRRFSCFGLDVQMDTAPSGGMAKLWIDIPNGDGGIIQNNSPEIIPKEPNSISMDPSKSQNEESHAGTPNISYERQLTKDSGLGESIGRDVFRSIADETIIDNIEKVALPTITDHEKYDQTENNYFQNDSMGTSIDLEHMPEFEPELREEVFEILSEDTFKMISQKPDIAPEGDYEVREELQIGKVRVKVKTKCVVNEYICGVPPSPSAKRVKSITPEIKDIEEKRYFCERGKSTIKVRSKEDPTPIDETVLKQSKTEDYCQTGFGYENDETLIDTEVTIRKNTISDVEHFVDQGMKQSPKQAEDFSDKESHGDSGIYEGFASTPKRPLSCPELCFSPPAINPYPTQSEDIEEYVSDVLSDDDDGNVAEYTEQNDGFRKRQNTLDMGHNHGYSDFRAHIPDLDITAIENDDLDNSDNEDSPVLCDSEIVYFNETTTVDINRNSLKVSKCQNVVTNPVLSKVKIVTDIDMEDLECLLCGDEMNDCDVDTPKDISEAQTKFIVNDCGHVFCMQCQEDYILIVPDASSCQFKCPIC